jgi:hypothetical protein
MNFPRSSLRSLATSLALLGIMLVLAACPGGGSSSGY